MNARTKNRRKADRLLAPGLTKEEMACDYAVSPMDEMARDMDRKWGIDRLPALVPPEMARNFGIAMARVNAAMEAKDADAVTAAAANAMRGLTALDSAATAAGAKTADGAAWEYDLDGFHFVVLEDDRQWQAAKDSRPDVAHFTPREVALALKFWCSAAPIEKIKHHFPAARIAKLPDVERLPSSFWTEGDQIPF